MSKTEQLITWGLLAFIAYELWPSSRQNMDRGFLPNTDSKTPTWIQNVAYNSQTNSMDSVVDDPLSVLLTIPQGPGGWPQWPLPPGTDYFNPVGGMMGLCQKAHAPAVTPPGALIPSEAVFS